MILRIKNASLHREEICQTVEKIHHMWDGCEQLFQVGGTIVDLAFMQRNIYLLPNLDLVIEDDMPDNEYGDIRGQAMKALVASGLSFKPVERIVSFRPVETSINPEDDPEADDNMFDLPVSIEALDRLLGDEPDASDNVIDIEDF